MQVVTSMADPSANIIFGAVVDDRYTGEIHVTLIATGFSQSFQNNILIDPKFARAAESRDTVKARVIPNISNDASTPRPRKIFF